MVDLPLSRCRLYECAGNRFSHEADFANQIGDDADIVGYHAVWHFRDDVGMG